MAGQIQRKKLYFQLDKKNNRKLQKSQQFIPDPSNLVQDIDTPEDWERAERMFQSI